MLLKLFKPLELPLELYCSRLDFIWDMLLNDLVDYYLFPTFSPILGIPFELLSGITIRLDLLLKRWGCMIEVTELLLFIIGELKMEGLSGLFILLKDMDLLVNPVWFIMGSLNGSCFMIRLGL